MMISPKSLDGSFGVDLKAIGAGPYSVESFKPNDTTELVRFDDFWSGKKDRPKKFTIKYVADDQTRMNSLRSGQANVAILSARQMSEAESGGLEVKVNPTSSSWVMYLNTSGPLKDLKVRQAVMYAIDRAALAKALSFGTGKASTQLFPEGTPSFAPDAEKYKFDPDKAKKLLTEAGVAGGVTVSWLLLNTPEYTQLAEAIQEQLAAVGITVNFTTVDVSQISLFISGEVGDVMMARWGGRADPLQALQVVVGEDATWAPAGVITPKLAELIAEAAGYSDSDPKRVESIRAASKETTDQVAVIPIMTRANIFGFKPGCIQNLNPYMGSGSPDWRDVVVGTGCSV